VHTCTSKLQSTETLTQSVRQKGITNETSVDFNYINHNWGGKLVSIDG